MSWRQGKRRKFPTAQSMTVTLPFMRGTVDVQLTATYGNWQARIPNLNVECNHRTQVGVLGLVKAALDEKIAGQFALPFGGGP